MNSEQFLQFLQMLSKAPDVTYKRYNINQYIYQEAMILREEGSGNVYYYNGYRFSGKDELKKYIRRHIYHNNKIIYETRKQEIQDLYHKAKKGLIGLSLYFKKTDSVCIYIKGDMYELGRYNFETEKGKLESRYGVEIKPFYSCCNWIHIY